MTRLLLVDDDEAFCLNLATWLRRAGYEVAVAHDVAAAAVALRERPAEVLITDLWMPGGSGLDLLAVVSAEHPATQAIFVTGQPSLEAAIAALREGRAFDFVLKPLRDFSAFRATIERAAARARELALVPRAAPAALPALAPRDREILGLLAHGLDNRAIAERLTLSERTVRNRLSALYDQLAVANRTQAVLWAQTHGLI